MQSIRLNIDPHELSNRGKMLPGDAKTAKIH
jgi:hypothetical protein